MIEKDVIAIILKWISFGLKRASKELREKETSEKRKLASRENGKLGGRPKKEKIDG